MRETPWGYITYLDYKYIDSGAMYRALTLFAIRNKILPDKK